MSTIAYTDGEIAADTGCTQGGYRVGHMTKIAASSEWVGGAAGPSIWCERVREWILRGCPDSDVPEAKEDKDGNMEGSAFVVRRHDGLLYAVEGGRAFPIRCQRYAIGSGKAVALGAMWAGATASVAVQAAIEIDDATYGTVELFNIREAR